MDAIMKLTTPLAFFTGDGGWNLPVRTADGWNAPPDGVQWQPWVNVDAPLQ